MIDVDGFDFGHEQGPLLLHALVILDLKLHVVQHHLGFGFVQRWKLITFVDDLLSLKLKLKIF